MSDEFLHHLLQGVAQGRVSAEVAFEKLRTAAYEPLAFAKLDHQRPERTGFPEVVWGPGKTAQQIALILARLSERNPVVMATRIEPAVFSQIQGRLPEAEYFPDARICAVRNLALKPSLLRGSIGIVSAGTADLPVAEEAAVSAELCGCQTRRLWDVGVSGIHRLLSNRELIETADVLIVVAGMEGALASVVGGLVAVPVIAVPTSVGYGASFNGLAALLTMLSSCAAGVGVVNIDNGFGAAMLAARILRMAQRRVLHSPE